MKKLLILLALLAPMAVFAQDDVGTCGWGSKLFEGNRGLAPKVLAVTTNGTSGNQTFAMSSATSGCSRDGVVRSNWKTVYFIDQNMNRLARDISRGEGETLASLSQLVGVAKADQVAFNTELKNNFSTIFASEKVDSNAVHAAMKTVLAKNQNLASYSNNL